MENGLLLIDKQKNVTSRQIDNYLGRKFGIKKIGHLGTLDPFATGLLIIAINKATKSLTYLEEGKKEYIASLKLGYSSSTLDIDGEITKVGEPPFLTKEKIEEVFSSFIGEIDQLAPLTSAHRINGKRMYEYAHKGIQIERKSYKVKVYSLELLSFDADSISFKATVGKGCYIRVLGEDIAKKLGSEGYLVSLRRSKVGPFDVAKAKDYESISLDDLIDPTPYIDLVKIEVDEVKKKMIMDGKKMKLDLNEEKVLFTYQGNLLAVYKKEDDIYISERGLF